MTPDDIHTEISEQHEAEPLEHVQLVRGAGSAARRARGVEAAEGRDGVQGEVEEEEEGVTEGEDEPQGRERAAGLKRRETCCAGFGMRNVRWCLLEGGVVVPGEEHGVEGDVDEIFDHGEIEEEERGDVG